MRLLVLGGTGFVGRHLVQAALDRGHTVTLFNRGSTAPGLFREAETILGDRERSHEPLRGRTWDACIDSNARLPRVAREAAALLAGSVGHYSYVSSISAYARPQPGSAATAELDETAPLAALAEQDLEDRSPRTYGGRKAVCERWIAEQVGARLLVVRPGLVVGPHDSTDRFTYWPVRLAEGDEVLAPGDGADAVHFVDARDLAAWTVGCVERGATGPFTVVGPATPLDMRGFLDACRHICNPAARLVWVSAELLWKYEVSAWSDMPVWLPRPRPPLSNARALEAGLALRPLDATISDTLAWAREAGLRRPLRAGLDAERERRLLARQCAAAEEPREPRGLPS